MEGANHISSSHPLKQEKSVEYLCFIGFIFGFVSIFLGYLTYIPLTGVMISVGGLYFFNRSIHKKAWLGWIGFLLNFAFTLVSTAQNQMDLF